MSVQLKDSKENKSLAKVKHSTEKQSRNAWQSHPILWLNRHHNKLIG